MIKLITPSLQRFLLFLFCFISGTSSIAQTTDYSIAAKWIKQCIGYIPHDGQGPTIHARNLFHTSIAMYDSWAVYNGTETYLLGKELGNFESAFEGFQTAEANADSAFQMTISYAVFRVLESRIGQYGSKTRAMDQIVAQFDSLGYSISFRSLDYRNGGPAELGNYIASEIIRFGKNDGSNEEDQHEPKYYQPVNPLLHPYMPGNPTIKDVNRWQPITVRKYIESKGLDKTLPGWNFLFMLTQDVFVTPEWGNVMPFSLTEEDKITYERDGEYNVYLDPGPPPLISKGGFDLGSMQYKWNFALNCVWSSFADPSDSVRIDISPGASGSQPDLPNTVADYPEFYDLLKGGVKNCKPHEVNPHTNKPYESNVVLRGDYVRVISEYWVDAINTYSPPGHWVDHLLQTSYDLNFKRQWRGKGRELSQLEWDIKSYFVLAGAMHDAAITCWGIKGFYDYIRPISAIRYMADKGQSSDSLQPRFHPHGLPLIDGYIELVKKNDPLAVGNPENIDKVKLYAWKGPNSVSNAFTDVAGVGWILAENWWPYQRYSFVTPNFAGYTSGHSTFSPCGAEVLTVITGDPYFPGGLHTFTARKNEFLEFEEGPTEDLTLQWATYHDAAAETCLSRIYGGIHPPADDIPGRKTGIQVARKAIAKAEDLFK